MYILVLDWVRHWTDTDNWYFRRNLIPISSPCPKCIRNQSACYYCFHLYSDIYCTES